MKKLFPDPLALQNYLNNSNLINQEGLRNLLAKDPEYNQSVHKNYPNLVNEWDPDRNGILTLKTFTKGSNYKAHWICKDGHQFSASIKSRTNNSGCPDCRYSNSSHNLKESYPHLLDEWNYERNSSSTPSLEPDKIAPKSDRKAWWTCKYCKNNWQAKISNRVNSTLKDGCFKYGCPTCSFRMKGLSDTNNFQFCYPDVAKEWHPSRNYWLSPKDVTPESQRKVWWLCSSSTCNHEWEAVVATRGKRQQGCPKCKGKIVTSDTSFWSKHPELREYWHKARNLELGLDPDKLFPQSKKKAYWQCDKDSEHIWLATIQSICLGSRCPYCAHRKVLKKDSFAVKCQEGLTFWDYDKNKGLGLDPNNLAPQSNKVVSWKCSKHGLWKTTIQSIYNGTRCPKCRPNQSILEKTIISQLRGLGVEVIPQYKIPNSKYQCDIYLPDGKIIIEIDGHYYHKGDDKMEKDITKGQVITQDFILIRVRDERLSKLNDNSISVLYKENEEHLVICKRLVQRLQVLPD